MDISTSPPTHDAVYQELYAEMRRYRDYELTIATWYTTLLVGIAAGVATLDLPKDTDAPRSNQIGRNTAASNTATNDQHDLSRIAILVDDHSFPFYSAILLPPTNAPSTTSASEPDDGSSRTKDKPNRAEVLLRNRCLCWCAALFVLFLGFIGSFTSRYSTLRYNQLRLIADQHLENCWTKKFKPQKYVWLHPGWIVSLTPLAAASAAYWILVFPQPYGSCTHFVCLSLWNLIPIAFYSFYCCYCRSFSSTTSTQH